MRNFAIGILIIFSCRETLAQDTIHFRDGAIKVAKIVEVGISNVKYYHYDNLNGPIHVSAKDEISFIKYINGSKDSFPKTSTNSNANTNSQGFVKIEIREKFSPINIIITRAT